MTDRQIIATLQAGNHLNDKELKRAKELVHQLQIELKSRKT